jgi:two-component system cell cycle response regulator
MKQRIVIADDDLTMRSLVSVRLGLAGFDVLSAENGADALALIRSKQPCAVLLDVRMPGGGGLQTLDAIRADPATRDLPVMMLTGERDPSTVVSAMGSGANDYMVKPFHPDHLLERVNRMIEAPVQKKESAAPVKTAPSRPVWEL